MTTEGIAGSSMSTRKKRDCDEDDAHPELGPDTKGDAVMGDMSTGFTVGTGGTRGGSDAFALAASTEGVVVANDDLV